MLQKELLVQSVSILREMVPGVSPEAAVSFLVLGSHGNMKVGELARTVGLTEPDAYRFLKDLTGQHGLVRMENMGDGSNMLLLTPAGQAVVAQINTQLTA